MGPVPARSSRGGGEHYAIRAEMLREERGPVQVRSEPPVQMPGMHVPSEKQSRESVEETAVRRPRWMKSRKRRSAERRAALIRPILETRRRRKANGQK